MKKITFLLFFMSLTIVSCTKTIDIEPEEPEQVEHVHTFSKTYSFDETHHWHTATCEHTDEISDEAEHVFDDGVVEVEPYYITEGFKKYSCKTCDYFYLDSLGYLSSVSEYCYAVSPENDDEPSVGHYFRKSGFKDGKSFEENSEIEPHDYEYELIDEADIYHGDEYKKTCKVCGWYDYEYIGEALQRHYCVYSEDWTVNEDWHWHSTICEHDTEGFNHSNESKRANHKFLLTSVTVHPYDTIDTYTCSVCGYSKDEISYEKPNLTIYHNNVKQATSEFSSWIDDELDYNSIVTIESDIPGTEIYYTTTGSFETEKLLYTGPITITRDTELRVRCYNGTVYAYATDSIKVKTYWVYYDLKDKNDVFSILYAKDGPYYYGDTVKVLDFKKYEKLYGWYAPSIYNGEYRRFKDTSFVIKEDIVFRGYDYKTNYFYNFELKNNNNDIWLRYGETVENCTIVSAHKVEYNSDYVLYFDFVDNGSKYSIAVANSGDEYRSIYSNELTANKFSMAVYKDGELITSGIYRIGGYLNDKPIELYFNFNYIHNDGHQNLTDRGLLAYKTLPDFSNY